MESYTKKGLLNDVNGRQIGSVGEASLVYRAILVCRAVATSASVTNLSVEQRLEIDRILDSEHRLMGLLRAQWAKIGRQRQLARESGFFEDTHDRTLAAQISQIESELLLAERRITSRVCSVLSPDQRLTGEGTDELLDGECV